MYNHGTCLQTVIRIPLHTSGTLCGLHPICADLSPVCFRLLFQVFGSVSLPYRPAARLFQAALSGIQQCIASVWPAARLLRLLFQTPDSVSFPVQTCCPSASSSFFRHSTDIPELWS